MIWSNKFYKNQIIIKQNKIQKPQKFVLINKKLNPNNPIKNQL